MIRIFLVLTLIMGSFGTWVIQERPQWLLDLAVTEWSGLRSVLTPPKEESAPETSAADLPYISENRGSSTIFEPRRRNFAPELSVPTAHASIILDGETGKVLYAKNAHDKRQIASLTKLMTALLIVETTPDLEALVTIDEEARYTEGTRVGCPRSGYCNGARLQLGEQLTVRNLLKAMLMNSANDAAIALAKFNAGSQEAFVQRMNDQALALGLTDSHFCTPSGLEIDGRESECYSSAADIAKIAARTLDHTILWDIMQLKETVVTSHDGSVAHRIFNTDQLLGNMSNLVGTKTGFTPLAGYSLLAVANHPSGGHPVIAVVLNDPYRWDSIRAMFSWSFQAYDWI